jgi:hypothetical protein
MFNNKQANFNCKLYVFNLVILILLWGSNLLNVWDIDAKYVSILDL